MDYSKWDKIELSDDEDVECHPNIDKASWIRWRQQDIHRKREERKQKIQMLKQEHGTNVELRKLLVSGIEQLKSEEKTKYVQKLYDSVQFFEKERKSVLFDENSPEYLQPKDVQEVFSMLLSRLCLENEVEPTVEGYSNRLEKIFIDELPKLDKRQAEVLETIAKEEEEQSKKLTSENICKEKFNKTIIKSDSKAKKTTGKKESSVEVLNPGYASVQKKEQKKEHEVDLRELSLAEEKMMLKFASLDTFEDSFKFIQGNPDIVAREYADHLMARSFRLQMEGRSREARLCAKWSLALSYSMQMGVDGVGLFYKRMTGGNPEPQRVFEMDVEQTYSRIKERSKVLREKEREISEENTNLTPEQAKAFKTFPKHFQDALMSNDIAKINESFKIMGDQKAQEVMEKCQECGLISVLSEEEAKKIQDEEGKREITA